MPDLIAFLRERLDEDEADARQLQKDLDRWSREFVCGCQGCIVASLIDNGSAAHPARVLAEVEAKRAILDTIAHPSAWFDTGEPIAILLAQPYADRPDFDPIWRADTPPESGMS